MIKYTVLLLTSVALVAVGCSTESTSTTTIASPTAPADVLRFSMPDAASGDVPLSTGVCRKWLDVFKAAKERANLRPGWSPERELADRLAELKQAPGYEMLPKAFRDAMIEGMTQASGGTCQ